MVDDMACRNNGKHIIRMTSVAAETLLTAYIYQWRDEDGHSQTEFIISILQQVVSLQICRENILLIGAFA